MTFRTPFTLTLALAGALALGCGVATTAPPKVVKIGAVLDTTGPLATAETSAVLDLAFEHVNAGLEKAGYKSMKLEYVLTDNQTNPPLAVTRALEIRASDDVKGIITDGTQVDIALNRTAYDSDPANDLNVPIIGTASNGPVINNPNVTEAQEPDAVTRAAYANGQKWNFRSTASSLPYGSVLVQIARSAGTNGDVNTDGIFKIGTYAIDDNFGRGGANGVRAAALAADANVKVEQAFQPFTANADTYPYENDLNSLTDATPDGVPDVIIETLSPQYSIAFTKKYINGNFTQRLLHTAAFQGKATLDLLGASANGQEGVTTVVLDGPSGNEFATAFQQKLGYAPNTRDTMLYDGTMTMLLATIVAVQENNLDDPTQVTGAQVRDAMYKIQDAAGVKVTSRADMEAVVNTISSGGKIDYVGASGPMDFDAVGNNRQKLTHYKVENLKFVEGDVYDCVTATPACPKVQ